MKNMIHKIILYYCSYYAFFNFLLQLLFVFCISKYISTNIIYYSLPSNEMICYDHFILKKLPSITSINIYFQYKSFFLLEYHKIYNNLFINNNNHSINLLCWYQNNFCITNTKDIINNMSYNIIMNKIILKENNYIPSNDISSYFPDDIIVDPNQEISPSWLTQAVEMTIAMVLYNGFNSNSSPSFEITDTDIGDTPLKGPDIINNDLPFETPVNIVVSEPDNDNTKTDNTGALIAMLASMPPSHDMLNSLYGPSYEGIRVYDEQVIFELHLKIVDIVRSKVNPYEIISQTKAINLIRETVHDYLHSSRLFVNLTINDLKNTNHIINLLIHEMIANSFFTEDIESFILKNVTSALIVETLCRVENALPSTYYDDAALYESVIRMTVARFIPS